MDNNIIDLILIFSMVISGSLALFQGFFKEFLALLGWVVAFINIKAFMPIFSIPLEKIINNDSLRDIVAISTIFIITLLIWRIISIPIMKIFKSSSISYLDKILGFIFGILRIIALACILYIYTLLPNEKSSFPEIAKNSKLLPFIEDISLIITENFDFFNINTLIESKKIDSVGETGQIDEQ